MLKRILIPIFIILLLLTAYLQASPITPTPLPSCGFQENVTQGPTCSGPVPVDGTQCQDQPYQASIKVLNSDRQVITKLQTDVNGYFKVPLPPGIYILHPLSGQPLPHTVDQTVSLSANKYTQGTILYDTGLLLKSLSMALL
jgi:hypothetical protein